MDVIFRYGGFQQQIPVTVGNGDVQYSSLPMVSMNEIPEVGDMGPAYAFQLKITNCPCWMRSVRYKLMAAQPGGGETVPDNSTLPLLTGSTASGVGVQIRLPNDTLHPFNVWRNVGYAGNSFVGNHTIQLRARIIRTAVEAQSGKIVSAIIFHMQYK